MSVSKWECLKSKWHLYSIPCNVSVDKVIQENQQDDFEMMRLMNAFHFTPHQTRKLYNWSVSDTVTVHRYWCSLVQYGRQYICQHSQTGIEQQLCRCIQNDRLAHLLFPLVWTFMKPWNILKRYAAFFKAISMVPTHPHHSVTHYAFDMRSSSVNGYLLSIVVPLKRDFQIIFLTYDNQCHIKIHAVLTRKKVVYRDGTEHVWTRKCPNALSLEPSRRPLGMLKLYRTLFVHTPTTCLTFTYRIMTHANCSPTLIFGDIHVT